MNILLNSSFDLLAKTYFHLFLNNVIALQYLYLSIDRWIDGWMDWFSSYKYV